MRKLSFYEIIFNHTLNWHNLSNCTNRSSSRCRRMRPVRMLMLTLHVDVRAAQNRVRSQNTHRRDGKKEIEKEREAERGTESGTHSLAHTHRVISFLSCLSLLCHLFSVCCKCLSQENTVHFCGAMECLFQQTH